MTVDVVGRKRMFAQVQNDNERSKYAKPWIHWACAFLHSAVLALRQLQAASEEDVRALIEENPLLRGMQDFNFCKLIERLYRALNNAKV
jgi:hypothetical protein